MARALDQIIRETDAVYNPQRDVYNQQIQGIEPAQQGELQGLEQAKTDSFNQISQLANRKGMFYSGIPIAEQAKYVGSTFLPAVAGLKNRYLQQKFNLEAALRGLTEKQYNQALTIRQDELDREEEQRQFDARLKAEQDAAAASRAAAGSGGGGGGGTAFSAAPTQANQGGQTLGQQETLRQRWQREANAGDWNAQVALNYAGDDGRYDGPVNSKSEYDILKSLGIQGNFYVRGGTAGFGGGGW